MADSKTILGAPGERRLLLGNEAVARGAVEAGVRVATTYPGTPASEIADTLAKVAHESGMYMEYSTNEIVAVETAAGAAICGARALSSMKHVGLNVASDALTTLAYVGVRGGFVVVSADDPSCWSSQNEQDSRYYALLANIPCLEPSTPQEAKDMLLYGFQLSEELELPVMLRLVTRVSHMRGPVTLGPVRRGRSKVKFVRDRERFVMVPANARVRHLALLERMDSARGIAERCPFNFRHGKGKLGVVTSGASYNYSVEALDMMDVEASVLRIGMVNPLPERLIRSFVKKHNPVVIIEELEPYLEVQVKATSREVGDVPIYGKLDGLISRHGELSTRTVTAALSKIFRKTPPVDYDEVLQRSSRAEALSPERPPVLCPGCPHTASFYAMKVAGGEAAIFPTDIGCYALGVRPPLSVGDVLICMGASAGLSAGISRVVENPVIGVVGDSTFFHASIPGLINAAYNNHNFVYVILDNQATAMTNFQPHPGTGLTGMGKPTKRVLIEDIAKACGVDFVRVVDPFDLKLTVSTIKDAVKHPGPAVVICRRLCMALELADKRRRGEEIRRYEVDRDRCNNCMACVKLLGCPALVAKVRRVSIDEMLCAGCGVCAQVCPMRAITEREVEG